MDIAIVGMSCKLPGAEDQFEFWKKLVDNQSCVQEVPESRWDWKSVWGNPAQEKNKTNSRWGGFVQDVDAFDHEFFGLIPRVVEAMDPQQRIMLELTWRCLEDAGIAPSTINGEKIGLVFSAFNHDYKEMQERSASSIEAHHSTGNASAVIANRVSHYFNLKGPSLAIDTACSGSLNALHCAVQALEFGDCDMAFAGGINLILTPTRHISFSKMGMMSPTGTCRTFDESANGYVRGEGAGVLLLKPLAKAVSDKDSIYGVIKGTAVNHCGDTYTLTYPSADAQANVIIEAHERANVPINTVSYIEAHGTGTPKGDPIEFNGLDQAFKRIAEQQAASIDSNGCALGSVKTNIGHLEAAAGVAGVIKVLMQLRNKELCAVKYFEKLNPKISTEDTPFFVVDKNRSWDRTVKDEPLRAGVSSFGFGGTNSHVVLEEAPNRKIPGKRSASRKLPCYPIVLSAKSADALLQRIEDTYSWVCSSEFDLIDLSYTLLVGREHLPCRVAFDVQDKEELIEKLKAAGSDFSSELVNAKAQEIVEGNNNALSEVIVDVVDSLKNTKKASAEQLKDSIKKFTSAFLEGSQIDWNVLFRTKETIKLNLPTYPFAKTRFWLDKTESLSELKTGSRIHPLLHENISDFDCQAFSATFDRSEHYLKDHVVDGTPVLPGAAYLEMVTTAVQKSSRFNLDQNSLRISDVSWVRPLQVDEGRQSVQLSLYPLDSQSKGIAKDDVANVDYELEFEFSSLGQDGKNTVHCQGMVSVLASGAQPLNIADSIETGDDLETIEIGADRFYALMEQSGLQYGDAHKGVVSAVISKARIVADISLPEHLNDAQRDAFCLHPSLLDSAIQSAVALNWTDRLDSGERKKQLWNTELADADVNANLPFLLDSLQINGKLGNNLRVSVSSGSGGTNELSHHDLSITNLDESGRALNTPVYIKGLTLKSLSQNSSKNTNKQISRETTTQNTEAAAKITAESQLQNISTVYGLSNENQEGYYTPQWVKKPLSEITETGIELNTALVLSDPRNELLNEAYIKALALNGIRVVQVEYGDNYLFDGSTNYTIRAKNGDDVQLLANSLKENGASIDLLLHLTSQNETNTADDADILAHFENANNVGASSVFVITKALIKTNKKLQIITAVHGEVFTQVEYLGLSGFYKTLALEKPTFSGRVVQVDSLLPDETLINRVIGEFASGKKVTDVLLNGSDRFVRQYDDCRNALATGVAHQTMAGLDENKLLENAKFIQSGVYIITGGMGALGIIFARHLLKQYEAKVYLTGRGKLNEAKLDTLEKLNELGGMVSYVQCDVNDLASVQTTFAHVRKESGSINGILHAAGIIEDSFILRKELESFERVIEPKTLGTVNLDLASRSDDIHCFVLFSSVTGALGNLGQCDYAFGNCFEDYYSLYRNSLALKGECSGRSVSINWPYWRDGGMTLSDKEEEILNRNFGIVPLETSSGIEALERALALPLAQIAVLPGHAPKVREVLGCVESLAVAPASTQAGSRVVAQEATQSAEAMQEEAISYLKELFSKELKIPQDRFTREGAFQDSGFDSVVMLDMIGLMENRFASLPKTLFFEYQNLNDLSSYLVENYQQEFMRKEVIKETINGVTENNNDSPIAAPNNIQKRVRRSRTGLYDKGQTKRQVDNRIAIVGLAGRYPDADNVEIFWDNLLNGKDCIREIPAERWELEKLFQPGEPAQGKSYSKWGGFLGDIDKFDALFFNISPKEAEKLDPQERLYLEVVSHAIENAGYHPNRLATQDGVKDNPVGVYTGVMWGDYQLHGVESENSDDWETPHSFYWSVANRISYFFNFSGPSLTLDTACSSSLTAIHLACNALINDEVKVAIAGGVNLSLHPNKYNLLSDMHFLSSDGRCRSFGEGGDGYVPGEGVGAVVLKPLADAERDGDYIYGVVRGTAVNHGGKTSGFTVPNPNRQAKLIQEAIQTADVDARHISYIEAHGTGTSLGDPIEISGLVKAFDQNDKQYCAIGSAKSNIGHTEAAAGMAGLTKVLMQMQHKTLAPSLHSDIPNPHIEMEKTPFKVNRVLNEWKRPTLFDEQGQEISVPRIAGISSFGAGGTNGHIIVEEYENQAHQSAQQAVLIPISARKQEALHEYAEKLLAYINRSDTQDRAVANIDQIAYTLQTGRVEFDWRAAFVVENIQDLERVLVAFIAEKKSTDAIYVSAGAVRSSGKQIDLSESNKSEISTLKRIAGEWVNGNLCDWEALYGDSVPARTPLPGYAYQRQSYWISKVQSASRVSGIHPVLEKNISTLNSIAYATQYKASDSYLSDHQINGHRVLPGVVYLEMAYQAIVNALPEFNVHSIYDIQWLKPIVVDVDYEEISLSISNDDFGYTFEIYQSRDNAHQVFCQGAFGCTPKDLSDHLTAQFETTLGIKELKNSQYDIASIVNRSSNLDISVLNQQFAEMGFEFGETFKPYTELYCNDMESLAKLSLPASAGHSMDEFVLNPVLMDGALRTSIAIKDDSVSPGEVPLPVSVDRVEVLRDLDTDIYVYAVRKAEHSGVVGRNAFDIYLLDRNGQILVFLENFQTQKVRGFLANLSVSKTSRQETMLKNASDSSAPPDTSKIASKRINSVAQSVGGISAKAASLASLKEMIGEQTGIDPSDIDETESVDLYGVESMMIHAINGQLEQLYSVDVSKTLFYEFSTIEDVAEHLVETYPDAAAALPGVILHGEYDEAGEGELIVDTSAFDIRASIEDLSDSIQRYLVQMIAEETGVSETDITATEQFESFGIDSVMINTFNVALSQVFGDDISKTLFYEYVDVEGLTEYFVENHQSEATAYFTNSTVISEVGETSSTELEEKKVIQDPLQSPFGHDESLVEYTVDQGETDENKTKELLLLKLEDYFVNQFRVLLENKPDIDVLDEIKQVSFDRLQLDDIDIIKLSQKARTDIGANIEFVVYQTENIVQLASAVLESQALNEIALVELVSSTSDASEHSNKQANLGQHSEREHANPANSANVGDKQTRKSVHPHRKQLARILKESGANISSIKSIGATEAQQDDIAIIGVSGRYPLADNLDDFWHNLSQGKDCIREIPKDRWDNDLYFNPDRGAKGSIYSKWGGFMDGVDQFDANLFNMTRREAEIVDPQERLFLQTAWQCLSDAAYTKSSLANSSVGVFAGVMWGHYELLQVSDEQKQFGRPSASFSSIPNRVSYHFDFHGPSLALDSMCSSSLSAIHTACQSIQSGDCEYAIAGGVNVATHVTKYQLLCQQQFLSDDGRCRAFGEGGSGYVPGEGVGAVFLKPLKKAMADGDNIYAVIKGSALNHGGKTSGFTVPNQREQSNVINLALQRSGWSPDSIQYVEAHGTGTSLGDPIELSGLTKAFKDNEFDDVQSDSDKGIQVQGSGRKCFIGSVKSNIGHLESAAGIAGLTKILLQMRHGKIAPSLHSSKLNPNLSMDNSGFTVPQVLENWDNTLDEQGNVLPKRAGISSFGAGGSNAHLLIEEFIGTEKVTSTFSKEILFILSADSEDRLSKYANNVLQLISRQQFKSENESLQFFTNLCYSSLIGRDSKAYRLAVACTDLSLLRQALESFGSQAKHPGLYVGNVENRATSLDSLVDDETRTILLDSLFRPERIHQLANAWVSSLNINWSQHIEAMLENTEYARISFPTQPLETERFWVDEADQNTSLTTNSLHPFLDSNSSTVSTQEFEKVFSGNEFYLRDHVIENNGPQVILPGVAYLEMARAAANFSIPTGFSAYKLRNVMWLKPISVNEHSKKVRVCLSPKGDGLEYRVLGVDESGLPDQQSLYSTGDIEFCQAGSRAQDAVLDLDEIRSHDGQIETKEEIYRQFKNMGFHYGPAYQVTEWRMRTETAALAKLSLPSYLLSDSNNYDIHPSLMDGALRTCLAVGDSKHDVPMVPFALEDIEVYAPITSECYAYATLADKSDESISVMNGAGGTVNYNLEVSDANGNILVKIKNVSAREFIRNQSFQAKTDDIESQQNAVIDRLNYFEYDWENVPEIIGSINEKNLGQKDTEGCALLLVSKQSEAENYPVSNLLKNDSDDAVLSERIIVVEAADCYQEQSDFRFKVRLNQQKDIESLYASIASKNIKLTYIVNALEDNSYLESVGLEEIEARTNRSLEMSVEFAYHSVIQIKQYFEDQPVRYIDLRTNEDNAFKVAFSGFANSMVSVNHAFEGACVSYQNSSELHSIFELLAKVDNINGQEYRYNTETGTTQKRVFKRQASLGQVESAHNDFIEDGTYVITGGLGKLGLIVAEHIVKHSNSNIALVGRSVLNEEQENTVSALNQRTTSKHKECAIAYFQADISDPASTQKLLNDCRNQFGEVTAVVHAAGQASEKSVYEIDLESFRNGLKAKIHGLVNLEYFTRHDNIRTFINFSSVSVHLGDLGNGCYASGNRFMDAFTARHMKDTNRSMVTVNWPLWETGGLKIPDGELAAMRYSGMAPMPAEDGINALSHILASSAISQSFVMYGNSNRISKKMGVFDDLLIDQLIKDGVSNHKQTAQVNNKTTHESAVINDGQTENETKDKCQLDGETVGLTLVDNAIITNSSEIIRAFIKQAITDVTREDADNIDETDTFESFGMDSVLLMELQGQLSEVIPGLPKTILFEQDSVDSLANFLINEMFDEVSAALRLEVENGVDETDVLSTAEKGIVKNEKRQEKTAAEVGEAKSAEENGVPLFETVSISHLFQKGYGINGERSDKRGSLSSFRSRHASGGNGINDDIAVVGMAGRFPNSNDLEEFWSNINSGNNCITEIPKVRWQSYLGEKNLSAGNYEFLDNAYGGFLNGVDEFDNSFFGMSKMEAAKMDPQLRLLLQTIWHALEDSAYTKKSLKNKRVGVFIGSMNTDFSNVCEDLLQSNQIYVSPGSVDSELANSVSFALDLHGPSLTVKTACSSSLSALHLAKNAINVGDCDMAIVGGVNLSLHPHKYLMLQDMKVLSEGSVEKTFDKDADGLIPSEGVGAVVLVPESEALSNSDNIHGLVKASTVSHSGVGAGRYIPNIKMLESTMQESLDKADINVEDLQYIESHGTATSLGDPIELKAIENIARNNSIENLYVGTKANLGHMEAASGICSLIKVLLSFKHNSIAPCANLSATNEAIDSISSPLTLSLESTSWKPSTTLRRVAAINSFGMGGSNAFAVIESPDHLDLKATDVTEIPLVLFSAESEEQVKKLISDTSLSLTASGRDAATDLASIAFTTQCGREHHQYRVAFIADDIQELLLHLGSFDSKPDGKASGLIKTNTVVNRETLKLLKRLAGKEMTRQLCDTKQWADLANLWVQGVDIDWMSHYKNQLPRKISLPGYPFKKTSCCVSLMLNEIKETDRKKRVNLKLVENRRKDKATNELKQDAVLSDTSGTLNQGDRVEKPGRINGVNGHGPGTTVKTDANLKSNEVKNDQLDFSITADLATQREEIDRFWNDSLNLIQGNPCHIAGSIGSRLEKSSNLSKELSDLSLPRIVKTISEDDRHQITRFVEEHQINIGTLAIGAWALVLNRNIKTKNPAFSVFETGNNTESGSQVSDDCFYPMCVNTMVKMKCHEWLSEVQSKSNFAKRNSFNTWIAESKENVCESSEINIQPKQLLKRNTASISKFYDSALTLDLKESAVTERDLSAYKMLVSVSNNLSAIEIAIQHDASIVESEVQRVFAEFIQVLMSFPLFGDKNPAAIPIGTRKRELKSIKLN